MEFQSSRSAMEMEVRTSTATHSLDGISEQHVTNGNGGQNINSNSQPGWNLRAACQQWKWNINSNSLPGWNFTAACQQWKSEYQQQLTPWMEFDSSMSAMEIRISTETHSLDGISQQHVSNGNQNINSNSLPGWNSEQHVTNGNGGQNINSNSQPGWNFRAACQQWKWRSEHQQQLTYWMEFHSSMSAREVEVRTSTATHILDGISEQQVSNGNRGQNINSNSQPGWNFRAAGQQWKWRSEHQQELTDWMEFQSSRSAMEMEVRTSTGTHRLDGISEHHVSNGNGGQNINSNSQTGWNFRAAGQQWK